MAPRFETLLLSTPADHILCIMLNRPHAANAFNSKMAEEIATVFASLSEIREKDQDERYLLDVRCIVITGAGERSFCAGADLKERDGMTDEEWQDQHVVFERMFLSLMNCPLPLIAAANGAAFGGGCEIVLCCDFIYASCNARFALTETSLGLIPGGGATQNLPRAVGMARAKEIILSAAPFSAGEAMAWGMVNHVCEANALMNDVLSVATKIASNAPLALRQAKCAISAAIGRDFQAAYAAEIEAYKPLIHTEDRHEGVRAFNEKRLPRYSGC